MFQQKSISPHQKSIYIGMCFGFVSIFILVIGGLYVWDWYDTTQGENAVATLASYLRQQEQEEYQRALADTNGGTTPQETLTLYVDAVSKKEFERAASYFVSSKQQEELAFLQNSSEENFSYIASLLKETSSSTLDWSLDKKEAAFLRPVFVHFVLYPNNIWKLVQL